MMAAWRGVAFAVAVAALCPLYRQGPAPVVSPPRRHSAPRMCPVLLPRAAFPRGMTQWTSERTTANVGAVASGLQQAHYRWGYLIVTLDVYPTVAAARRRYIGVVQLLHGGRQARAPRVGQQIAVWITRDQLVGDTVTTILLRSGTTVAMINVGARAPAVDVAARVARAVSAHSCR